MTRSSRRVSRVSIWALIGAVGLLALILGTFVTPDALMALSADRSISAALLAKFLGLRALSVLCGALAIGLASWKRWGSRLGMPIALISIVWVGMVMRQLYPNNLLPQPSKLLRAVLGEEMLLSDYDPKPQLAVVPHEVLRAKFPVINIHAHFRYWYQHWTAEDMHALMQMCNVDKLVDLDGGLGKSLREEIRQYVKPFPDHFIVFSTLWFPVGTIDWSYFKVSLSQLEEAKQLGARGIKIWKNLGLRTRDAQDRVIPVDDARFDPLWETADRLKLPILIHLGDPAAFFDPICSKNERYEELHANPDWSFYGPQYPSPDTILGQFEHVLSKHPEVTFILAHLGNRAENLRVAAALLDRHPNLFMDISARVSELGRQPVTARKFFLTYQDRLVFGTDGNPDVSVYRAYFRFLETRDEYFDYPFWPRFNYGRWKIYGIDLPDEVLRKLYHDNAAKILGLPLLAQSKGRS